MRNRAKCKLCGDIIESFHRSDFVSCKCDQITVSGGPEKFEAYSVNWANFIRVDDEGNEIIITVQNMVDEKASERLTENLKEEEQTGPTKNNYVKVLEEFCDYIDKLPVDARLSSVTHVDLVSILRILLDIFRYQ